MSNDIGSAQGDSSAVRWRVINAVDRRVLGVLVEKAKTTPDVYPLSVNALRAGCNQKNNRDPEMQLETDDVEESLSRLRELGAVAEVQGGGRVPRFRHYLYDWFGVDKVELAVMAELLLRGAQTEGELRGRAARMEPIADVQALRPVLGSLKAKGLVLAITPEGRGHIVTHALYEPHEMERVAARLQSGDSCPTDGHDPPPAADASGRVAPSGPEVQALQRDVADLREEVRQLRHELEDMRAALG